MHSQFCDENGAKNMLKGQLALFHVTHAYSTRKLYSVPFPNKDNTEIIFVFAVLLSGDYVTAISTVRL
jgi:hypothetical protein